MKFKRLILFMMLGCAFSLTYSKNYKKEFEKAPDWETAYKIARKELDDYDKKILKASDDGGWFNKSKQELKDELKTKLNTKDSKGWTQLFYGVMGKDIDVVKRMIAYGADVNAYADRDKAPVLSWAISCSTPQIVKELVDHGANCNYKYNSDKGQNITALMEAIWRNDREIINVIYNKTTLFNGICKDTELNGEYTPIQYCSILSEDYFWIIKKLITEKNIDINTTFVLQGYKSSILELALESENDEFIDLIIGKVNTANVNTELYSTADDGSKQTFKVLNMFLDDFDGKNKNRIRQIKDLVENKKADVDSIYKQLDSSGKVSSEDTILNMIVYSDWSSEVKAELLEYFLKAGADPNKKCMKSLQDGSVWEYTPFHGAAYFNYSELYELIKENRGDKNLKDSYGYTPLDYKRQNIKNIADRLDFSYEESGSSKGFLSDYGNSWADYNGNFNVVSSSDSKQNLVQIAIKNGDSQSAIELLKSISWEKTDANGKNSLDYAFSYNQTEIVKNFIENKVQIGSSIFAAIDAALKSGNTEFLRQFLSYCNFKNVSKKYGVNGISVDPVVYTTIVEGEISNTNRNNVLNLLVENKDKFTVTGLNSRLSNDGKTPLLMSQDEQCIIKLLEYGANYDLEDNAHENAKDYAFKNNYTQVIKWFLDHKVKMGNSLFSAIDSELNGHDSYLSDFIKIEGVNTVSNLKKTIPTDNGYMVCGLLVYTTRIRPTENLSQYRTKIINQLIECGLDINETVSGGEYNGSSALLFAAMNKNYDLAKFLIEKGANINQVSKGTANSGRTALFYALENHDTALTKLILKETKQNIVDVQLNNSNDNNATLLMFIARYADFETASTLIPAFLAKNPYSLEKKDKSGLTPFLYAAAYNSDYRIMKVLRMYGADVFAKDYGGKSALALAKENNNSEIVIKRIESYGVYE